MPARSISRDTNAKSVYAAQLAEIAERHPNVQILRCYAEAEQCGELQGLFHREQLAAAVPDYAEAQTFLCGPPGMMDLAAKSLKSLGVPPSQIHYERFEL